MALHEFPIIQQGRILANLFGDFAMFIQEPVEFRTVPVVGITISSVGIAISSASISVACVMIAVVEILQSHERIRPLADLLFNTGMVLQIPVQLGMALQELRVIDQGRRPTKLLGIFAMTIQELIESRQVPACDVVIVVLCNLSVL